MRAILRSGWSMQNLTNTGKIFVFLFVLGFFLTYPPKYSSSMRLSFGLLHLDLVSCCFIDIQNYIYSIVVFFCLFFYPKHVSWVPFLPFFFFLIEKVLLKKMLWQTTACICSVAKSIIFEWKRLIYLFSFRWKNCCSKVLLWKENCLVHISVLYFERSCYNEEICKPVHSSVLCSIQNFKEHPPSQCFD